MSKPLLSASNKSMYTSTYYPLIICKENPLTASYYFSIFDLSTERCLFKDWSAQNMRIQSTTPSHSCNSEFNMYGKANRKIQITSPQRLFKENAQFPLSGVLVYH